MGVPPGGEERPRVEGDSDAWELWRGSALRGHPDSNSTLATVRTLSLEIDTGMLMQRLEQRAAPGESRWKSES